MTRLETICSLIQECDCIADIGCDHGKVSEFIFNSKLCKRLVVNDISEPSIAKAKLRLAAAAESDRSNTTQLEFITAGGQTLQNRCIDCAIVAGVGGHIIIDIVENLDLKSFILSPQNYPHGVRQNVCENGYRIIYDKTVADNDKFYDIIKIEKGDTQSLDELQLHYGVQYKEFNQDLLDRLYTNEKAVCSYAQTPQNIEKLRIIREVIKWQLLSK